MIQVMLLKSLVQVSFQLALLLTNVVLYVVLKQEMQTQMIIFKQIEKIGVC